MERLAGLPHPVGEREHLHVAEHARLFARRVGGLADDHRPVRDTRVGGPLEHAADDLALEARDVELALAGDDELGAVERGVEPGGLGDDVEAGLEARAERGEAARRARPRRRCPRAR